MTEDKATVWECTAEQYHADHGKIGSSMLKQYRNHPARYQALYVTHTLEQTPSGPAQQFGTLVHLRLLEPKLWETTIAIGPDCDKKTKKWKDFVKANEGKTPIQKAEAARVIEAVEAVYLHPVANGLIEAAAEREHTVVWTDEFGLTLKTRRDLVVPKYEGARWIVDLKTSRDTGLDGFAKSVANFDYHCQSDFYLQGDRALGFDETFWAWIILPNQERDRPYRARVYEPSPAMLEIGARKNRVGAEQLARSYETDVWVHDADNSSYEIDLPAYAAREEYAP